MVTTRSRSVRSAAACTALCLLSSAAAQAPAQAHHAAVFDASVASLVTEYPQPQTTPPLHTNPDVEALLANMTLAEKVAQMTQLDIYSLMNGDCRDPLKAVNVTAVETYAKWGIGSLLNAPFPGPIDGRTGWSAEEWRTVLDQIKAVYKQHSKTPMVYGIDTIHGATYVRGATLFGQPLSAASSFNLELVFKMGEIEAKDTLAAGIPWVFSPVLGIAVQPKWSRVYETFGEDPFLASQMGASIISGIQKSGKVAACMKHFIGYSNPIDGLDRADNVISDWDLVNYFAPSFLAATRAGVKTAMETYVSVNGFPVIASKKLLTDLLRNDMNFSGMMVSDYSEIQRMVTEHKLVATEKDAIRVSLAETSLDMSMGQQYPLFLSTVDGLIRSGELPQSRIDESVRRILSLKAELGLFSEQQPVLSDDSDPVGSKADQRVALSLAQESVVLLENSAGVLPLQFPEDSPTSVFLTGPLADNKGFMCGGWSVFWSGSSNSSHFPNGFTIKDAVTSRLAPRAVTVEHLQGVTVEGHYSEQDWVKARSIASRSKYTIVVLGEGTYAEKAGDITDLALPHGQRAYLEELSKVQTTQIILVLVAGRPRTLHGAHKGVHAVVASFLPCEQGGEAIAQVLLDEVNPSAKLPITYPLDSGNAMPYFHRVNTVCDGWKPCEVEWPFGYGLSYTQFEYSELTLSASHVKPGDSLRVQVTVKNVGAFAGKEAVLLFIKQKHRLASVPETKMLKKFQKIALAAGESKQVEFELSMEDWGYYRPQIGMGFHREVEVGEYVVSVPRSIPSKQRAVVESAEAIGRGGPSPKKARTASGREYFEELEQSFFIVA